MEFKEFSAKTVNDCITEACTTFVVPSDKLEYEVVSEGSSGFMGIGAKPAIIKARVKEEATVQETIEEVKEEVKEVVKEEVKTEVKKAEASDNIQVRDICEDIKKQVKENKKAKNNDNKNQAKPAADKASEEVVEKKKIVKNISAEEIETMKEEAVKFLKDVFVAMKIEANITCDYTAEDYTMNINIEGEEMGVLIGKRGQTLDSLQYLVSLVINKGTSEYVRVKVDTENYRSRRKETLENLAKNMAFKVKRTRRPVSLEPMNPYERRIIHSALQNDRYVTTHSEGDEPFRKVVINLKK